MQNGKETRPYTNGTGQQNGHYSHRSLEIEDYANQVQEKYSAERKKRLRADGNDQFVPLHASDKFHNFTRDPWLPSDGSVSGLQLEEGNPYRFKFLIQGAGYGGLLYAGRLVEAGFKPSDIALVDYAGGFGGTWYWNRYPGLMCDVAAEIYMPLLEETGHMPKHKYAYGQELRGHADRIVVRYGLQQQGVFRSTIKEAAWNDEQNFWEVVVSQEQGPKQGAEAIKIKAVITADYFMSLTSVLNYPKLPKIPGVETFDGHQFHTSRWDYQYTGGCQEEPDLANLRDKNVALVGTGATNVQILPHLAKWAKNVYVFQRTPSSINARGQKLTDPEEWKRSCAKPGWQRARMDNFAAFVSDVSDKPAVDLVNDGWTSMPSYKALVGGPHKLDPTRPDTIADHITHLHTIDFARQERVRARIDEIIKDKEVAEKLKPWYPGFCKRPCFHDDYLPAFNQPNVKLIDTEGKGIDKMTSDGVIYNNEEYKVDCLIWGTGFVVTAKDSPGERAHIAVKGRKGLHMFEKWRKGVGSLYGFVSRDFPNFFFSVVQGGVTANNIHIYEASAEQTIYTITEAEKRYPDKRVVIEPSHEAEEAWSMRIASNAAAFAAMPGCTPGYLNGEGAVAMSKEQPSMAEKMKKARAAPWGQGILDYQRITKQWRDEGNIEGLEVSVIE